MNSILLEFKSACGRRPPLRSPSLHRARHANAPRQRKALLHRPHVPPRAPRKKAATASSIKIGAELLGPRTTPDSTPKSSRCFSPFSTHRAQGRNSRHQLHRRQELPPAHIALLRAALERCAISRPRQPAPHRNQSPARARLQAPRRAAGHRRAAAHRRILR